MSFVKMKPNKKVTKAGNTQQTLGACHNSYVESLDKRRKQIPVKLRELKKLQKELAGIDSHNLRYAEVRQKNDLADRIRVIKKDVSDAQAHVPDTNYYYSTLDIMLDYSKQTTTRESGPPSPGSVGDSDDDDRATVRDDWATAQDDNGPRERPQKALGGFFGEASAFVSRKQTNNKGQLLDRFMKAVDPAHESKSDRVSKVAMCDRCQQEMVVVDNNLTCTSCGNCVASTVDTKTSLPSQHLVVENTYFAYKRINHFKEWLSQFQAKESTKIPQEVYEHVLVEVKKAKIHNLATLTPEMIRKFLKKLRMNKYYEHTSQILSMLCRLPPPVINRDIEEKLCSMFMEIQDPFEECAPSHRKNFLSYSYVLHKMTEILGLAEFSQCFSLLKSREKLHLQDSIWRCICSKLGWPYYASM
jgi:hypothetical protein